MPFAFNELVRKVGDGVLVRKLAGAQIGATALGVAGGEATFAIGRHISEVDVLDIEQLDRRRGGFQAARDAIGMIIGEQDVLGIADLQ